VSDRVDLEYNVQVTGLGEAQAAANSASESADQAAASLQNAQAMSSSSLPTMLMSVRAFNAARLAITQTTRAVTDLNPTALLYGFLNMIQVVRNLTQLTKMLKDSTGAAASAQAILATLTGNWWVIPLALAAGALVYSRIRSMQTGGVVPETGVYLLHRRERVIPAHQSHSYGPMSPSRNSPAAPWRWTGGSTSWGPGSPRR